MRGLAMPRPAGGTALLEAIIDGIVDALAQLTENSAGDLQCLIG